MNSNSNLNWRAAFGCKFLVQLVDRAQNFAPGRHGITGMIRTSVTRAEDGHETVAQILVNHPAMFLFNRAHAKAEKVIHDFHDFGRRRGARAGRPRTHVDEHDGDLFFDTAQSGVPRKYSVRCASAYVQAESLTQFLFVPEFTNHLIEFT